MESKDHYKIGEISNLYGIGTDSLRYYEKIGILKPKRDSNGYRMYNINDIRTLNILRELRKIGFSLQEIKDHLINFDIEKTITLFETGIEYIDERTAELAELRAELSGRVDEIQQHKNTKHHEEIEEKLIPNRNIVMLSENTYRDQDLDFIIKRLQKENQQELYIIGNGDIGASIPLNNLEKGDYGEFRAVFHITESSEFDQVILGGTYLCRVVKGSYQYLPLVWQEIMDYIQEHHYLAIGNPLELYLVDNHTTSLEPEYVTELQVLVKKRQLTKEL